MRCVVVAPGGVRHAERLKEARARELRERHAADARDDDGRQIEPGVAVGPVGARREVGRALAADDVEHVRVRVCAGGSRPAADAGDAAPIAETARVVEHVPDRQAACAARRRLAAGRRRIVRQFRDVLADLIVERQLALAREQQHGRRGELLGDRAGLEDRLGHDLHVVLEVGHAVALRQCRPAAGRDADRAARRGGRPTREDGVHLRFDARRHGGLTGQRDRHGRERQREQQPRDVFLDHGASAKSYHRQSNFTAST